METHEELKAIRVGFFCAIRWAGDHGSKPSRSSNLLRFIPRLGMLKNGEITIWVEDTLAL